VTQDDILVGDIVALRTGGPTMLVQARSQDLAYCAWRSAGGCHYGTFEVGGLQLAAETVPPNGGDCSEVGASPG
jgi:uncharacterized protein YodC (DUF2158 family)